MFIYIYICTYDIHIMISISTYINIYTCITYHIYHIYIYISYIYMSYISYIYIYISYIYHIYHIYHTNHIYHINHIYIYIYISGCRGRSGRGRAQRQGNEAPLRRRFIGSPEGIFRGLFPEFAGRRRVL